MERRKALAKDGRPYGKRHRICDPCRGANTQEIDAYRKRIYLNGGRLMVPYIGTKRRLQALSAMGWTCKELSRRSDREQTVLANLTNGHFPNQKTMVYPETAEKIAALYNELSMVPPPEHYTSARQATRARGLGYVGPLSWDDESIDDLYAPPSGLTREQAFRWFWYAATMTERIQWVLQNGLGITRAKWYTYH